MLSIQQLLTPVSEEEALQTCLDILTSLGFSAGSWQPGSRERTLVQMFARMYAGVTTSIRDIAAMGLNEYAVGDWLALLSRSHYDNEPLEAVATQGTLSLVAAANAPGPQSINAGQLVFADNTYGYTYRNRFAFTLTPGTTHSVEVEAEVAAANRDVPVNTITVLKTPIAGVTVNNPPIGSTGTWITRNGADRESDDALRARNRSKWGTLGIAPGLAYSHYAAKGHASVRRVYVDDQNPRGPGTIDIYIAGDSGSLAQLVVDAVTDYMHGVTDGFDKVGTGADLLVQSATDFTVTIEASVYVLAQHNTTATHNAITAKLQEFFKSVPVGGFRTSSGGQGTISLGHLYSVMMTVAGVQNVAFSNPTSTVYLSKHQVAVPSLNITFYSV